MIDLYGADALRYSLVRLASKGQDIKFSEGRIPEARNFCTKIWNAARFVLMNVEGAELLDDPEEAVRVSGSVPEKWILTRLQQASAKVNAALMSYDMDDACSAVYEFFWSDYCDWFVELSKPALRSDDTIVKQRTLSLLVHVLDSALRLMHPIMPFVTEEIWQQLPGRAGTIMQAPYPLAYDSLTDIAAADQMETVIDAVRAVRNARAELSIAHKVPIAFQAITDTSGRALVETNLSLLENFAGLQFSGFAETPPRATPVALRPGIDLYLFLDDMVDVDKERARVAKDLADTEKELARITAKLSNAGFLAKAAPEIIAKDRASHAELTERQEKLAARRDALGA
jgi:valyl-tRNA synthetase